MEVVFTSVPFQAQADVLFGAKSYFMDRFTPAVEEIRLPAFELHSGQIKLRFTDKVTVSSSQDVSPLRRGLANLKTGLQPQFIEEQILVDFRCHSPANWAHALHSHIPLAFLIQQELKDIFQDHSPLFILSKQIPTYIRQLYQFWGLQIITTDGDIRGKFVEFEITPFQCLRSAAPNLIQQLIAKTPAYQELLQHPEQLPEKVFLSRRDTRKLTNEAMVEECLASHGFQKLYPENLTVPQQLALFIHATDMVAVHGAGMGPLLYRSPGRSPLRLVEILSPGHMTKFYRGVAHQIGARWVGVRGRLEAKQIQAAYDFNQPFLTYSLDDFYVDLDSLELALTRLNQPIT
jgi:hypothetical protein